MDTTALLTSLNATLIRSEQTTVNVLLTFILVIAILEVFGVQATTFAARLAGAGLAVGAAWSGLLSNFTAGRTAGTERLCQVKRKHDS